MSKGTYGIRGLPRPADAVPLTKTIPYVENLPLRYEISLLSASSGRDLQIQWTLFVLALDQFKAKPVDEKLSYFRIAGIHGYPGQPWDQAPAPPSDTDDAFGGYCNHNCSNFPTWHRPYMALFEQCIWENMQMIIRGWVRDHGLPDDEAALWYAQGERWRMPYWDWARDVRRDGAGAIPNVLQQSRVEISPPSHVRHLFPEDGGFPSPFLSFENPTKDERGNPKAFGDQPPEMEKYNIKDSTVVDSKSSGRSDLSLPWSRTTRTSRYGLFKSQDSKGFTGLQGRDDQGKASEKLSSIGEMDAWNEPRRDEDKTPDGTNSTRGDMLKSSWWNAGSLSDAVGRMFSPGYISTWAQFASTRWYAGDQGDLNPTGYMSVEYIHNNVHNMAGGASWEEGIGHLSDVPVAAFDPLFWLLHCQMDRLLAIWQCLYWRLWWDDSPSEGSANEENPFQHLEPFHTKSDGDPNVHVWTSEQCRDWTVLNYQYDDLWHVSQRTIDVDGTLDETKFVAALQAHVGQMYPGTGQYVYKSKHHHDSEITLERPLPLGGTTQWNDYIINVVYDRYALDGQSYTIEFYLSLPTGNHAPYERSDHVGEVYTFGGGSRSPSAPCSNCKLQKRMGVLSRGQVTLTVPLMYRTGDICSKAQPNQVGQYLAHALHWRFVDCGGASLNASLFPNTRIEVLCGTGTLSHGSGITLYDGYVSLPEATEGKPWGVQRPLRDMDRHKRKAATVGHLAKYPTFAHSRL